MNFTRKAAVLAKLETITLPYLQLPLTKALKNVAINAASIRLQIELPYLISEAQRYLFTAQLESLLAPEAVELELSYKIHAHVPSSAGLLAEKKIKNCVAIASGKGGVGKSTTATNMAIALQQLGAKVGLLDADIYGPNQPHLLNIQEKTAINEHKKLIPLEKYGIQSISMGYLIDDLTPVVWRGPMISSALTQLLKDTEWGELDYLLIDLPPGTGDVQLTLAKSEALSAVVMVTTPQEVALLDVRRAVEMFKKTQVPIIGVIENMSTYQCRHCGQTEAIFGTGGAARLMQEYQLPLLAQIPLHSRIAESAEQGQPIVMAKTELAKPYQEAAAKMTAYLSLQRKSYHHLFGSITIEKN